MSDLPEFFNKRNVKKKSQKKEKLVARELGGSTQIASGALFNAKGDISLDEYLVEHKYTDNKSYSITVDTLSKIENEAITVGKKPMMVIEVKDKKYALIRYGDLT